MDKEISLTLNRDGKIITTKIHPQAGLGNNLYDAWIDINQKRVDERGKVA
jgi:hypothetical protein